MPTRVSRSPRPPRRSVTPAAAPFVAALALAAMPGAVLVVVAPAGLAAQPDARGTARVQGVVTSNSAPVANAQVALAGTRFGALTDAQGRYTIGGVPAGSYTLRVQRIGFAPFTQPLTVADGQTVEANVAVTAQAAQLTAVQVVGYTTEQRRDVTGAVTQVRGDDIQDQKVATVEEALRGRVPGVQIQATGQPGRPAAITIRGQTSLLNSSPLYVVDGMYVGNQNPNLNPDDIASIDILKDASAAAQYGSQASNGVVVITTRRGQAAAPQFSFNTYYGFQQVPKTISMAGTGEFQRVFQQAYRAGGVADSLTPVDVRGAAAASTDWQDALFETGAIQNYNLQASGGSANASYLISGGMLDQQGTVINTNFRRYSLRVNTQATRGRVTVGENLAVSQGRQLGFGQGIFGGGAVPLIDAVILPPTIPVRDASNPGGYGYGSSATPNYGTNPVGAQTANYNRYRLNQVLGSAFGEVRLFGGLRYRLNLGVNYNDSTRTTWNSSTQLRYLTTPANPSNSLLVAAPRATNLLWENLLTYDGQFGGGQHRVSAVAGQTSQRNQYEYLDAARGNFQNEQLQQINAGSTTQFLTNSGTTTPFRNNSLLSRVTYAFKDRYLLTGSARRDCSSRFSPDDRCGNFGAGSVGWVASEEGFFKSIPVLGGADFLKLRASTGVLGDQNIGDFAYQALVNQNVNYIVGGQVVSGAIPLALVNTQLRWQRNRSTDVGLDLGLFGNALYITADYYSNVADRFLVNLPIPTSLGSTTGTNAFLGGNANPAFNAGRLKNAGLEVGVTHRYNDRAPAGAFRLNTTLTLTTTANKVLSLGNGGQPITNTGYAVERTEVGYPIGEFYVRQTCGLFQSTVDVAAHKAQAGAQPGDVCYVDLNNDGAINDADRYHAGSPVPKLTSGLFFEPRWRSFDFGLNLRGSFGSKIYNVVKYNTENTSALQNVRAGLTFWTPETPNTDVPRAVFGAAGADNFNPISDKWLESGNFVRLQNLVVGYTLPPAALRAARLGGLGAPRLYVNVQNLYTFTKYSGFDPEVLGNGDPLARGLDDGRIYPNPRTITIGFDTRF